MALGAHYLTNNCSFLCCRYTSQVHLTPPVRVISRVYDSTLFDHLDSTWDFQAWTNASVHVAVLHCGFCLQVSSVPSYSDSLL